MKDPYPVVEKRDGTEEEFSRKDLQVMMRAFRLGWVTDEEKQEEIRLLLEDLVSKSLREGGDRHLGVKALKALQEGSKLDLHRIELLMKKMFLERQLEAEADQRVVVILSKDANEALLDEFRRENL